MDFSLAMLRALGKGVDRLNDGDAHDRRQADDVIHDMRRHGYLYQEGSFTHEQAIFVNGHMHPNGAWSTDLTDSDFEEVIRAQGSLLPEMDRLIDECRYLELPLSLLVSMAGTIRNIRQARGLRFEPQGWNDV